jgi:hypothetical protein
MVFTLLGAANVSSEERLPSEFAPEKTMEGTIQELDFGANTMIFQGVRIRMAPDVQVEIRGSYGAFTMLQVGMKALVTYRVLSPSEREAVHIEQLPDNYTLEEA